MNILNYIWFFGIIKHLVRAVNHGKEGDDNFKKQNDKEVEVNGPSYSALKDRDEYLTLF